LPTLSLLHTVGKYNMPRFFEFCVGLKQAETVTKNSLSLTYELTRFTFTPFSIKH
jgi:hypothetical protein